MTSKTRPFTNGVEITPSDVTLYSPPLRGLYIGTAGTLTIVTPAGTELALANHPVGYVQFEAVQVMDSGTDADDIIGGW